MTRSRNLRGKLAFVAVLLVVPILVSACVLQKSRRTAPPASKFKSEPIAAIGHGSFTGSDGKSVTPDAKFIAEAQRYYVATLQKQLTTQSAKNREALKKIEETRSVIYDLVQDEILANALYLDWLIERVRPDGLAQLTVANNALRWYYVLNLQPNPILPKDNLPWSKGINDDIAKVLEDWGVSTYLLTNAAGPEYRKECRDAGVPVPDTVFSSDWTNRGTFDNEFLADNLEAELWIRYSDNPPGVCLALPRYSMKGGIATDDIEVLGVICLGTQSNKACFFDNPRGVRFRRNVVIRMDRFVGGTDLVANAQGVCSDCHAGENPYIVHPEKSAFSGLTQDLLPQGWHDPLVDASWPQNPGPTNILAAVTSPQRCDGCHSRSFAGRFPEVSRQLPQYCRIVLGTATGGAPKQTMPMGGGSITPYQSHVEALRNSCGGAPSGGGVVVDASFPDGVHVSPPLVIDPLYQCATQVAVRGAVPDAKVILYINGAVAGTVVPARNPDKIEFTGLRPLVVGDVVLAEQVVGGVPSGPSPSVTVRDHRVDFPAGLPKPDIDPTLIYECADVIAVRHVPGARLTVFINGADPVTLDTSTGWTGVFPGKHPFRAGDTFTAEISLCNDRSPTSDKVQAVAAPASLPPARFNPTSIYAGQEFVTLEGLTHGSWSSITEASAGVLAKFTTPVSWQSNINLKTPLGRALKTSDSLSTSQTLCALVANGSPVDVQVCEELPAPVIKHPLVGEQFVIVNESVPGARIRVYDSASIEIGDGAGTVIWLTRPITGADTLTVTQQVGDCMGTKGYLVNVRNPGSKPK